MRSVPFIAAGVLAALGGGCHLLVDFGELPDAEPPPASPLGSCTAAPAQTPSVDIVLGLTFLQNDGTPAAGALEVKACPVDEAELLTCTTPISDTATPDASGYVELVVRPGEDLGLAQRPYVRAEKAGQYFPTSILTWPEARRSAQLPDVIAVSEGIVDYVAERAKLDRATQIDERGHLLVIVHDCEGRPVPNIEVFVDEVARDTTTIEFTRGSDGQPDLYNSTTDDDGIVVYLALPAPSDLVMVPLRLRDGVTRQDLVRGALDVPVRRGELTMLVIDPRLAT